MYILNIDGNALTGRRSRYSGMLEEEERKNKIESGAIFYFIFSSSSSSIRRREKSNYASSMSVYVYEVGGYMAARCDVNIYLPVLFYFLLI